MDNETELPIVKVNGVEIVLDLYASMMSVVVEQSVQVPDMITICFTDPDFDIFDQGRFGIGDDLDISFTDGDSIKQVSSGQITALSVEPGSEGLHELVVTGLGHGHRLANGSKVRTFLEVTDADMVRTIAGEHGLQVDVDSTTMTYPWMMQDQDDYTFLTKRAQAIGFEWWVSDQTLHFKKKIADGTSAALQWPDDLFSFSVRVSAAEAIDDVQVRGWDPDSQQSFVAKSTVRQDADALGSNADVARDANQDMQVLASSSAVALAPMHDPEEAERLANSIVLRSVAEQVHARGVSVGARGPQPGTNVIIKGMGEKLSGSYLVTSVDHVYRAGEQYITRFRAGGREPDSLVDLLGAHATQINQHLGPQLIAGVVTDLVDPEQLGRVKVNFPSLGDNFPSEWARMCGPGAGSERGLLVFPELGDEVLVGFENGDPRRPLILTSLWSKTNMPPETAAEAVVDDQVQTKGFYTKHGHKFEMSDGPSDETKSISMELEPANKLYLGADLASLEVPKPLTITGQDQITITADNKGITIKGGTIEIEAAKDLSLSGNNVSIKAQAEVKIEGAKASMKGTAETLVEGAKTDVKASGMLNVQAGGIASVKGSMVQLG